MVYIIWHFSPEFFFYLHFLLGFNDLKTSMICTYLQKLVRKHVKKAFQDISEITLMLFALKDLSYFFFILGKKN